MLELLLELSDVELLVDVVEDDVEVEEDVDVVDEELLDDELDELAIESSCYIFVNKIYLRNYLWLKNAYQTLDPRF